MNAQTLKSYALVRGLNQSDLARAAGVTRQTVSHWFSGKVQQINLYSKHLQNLAQSLGVSVETLSQPLPILDDPKSVQEWETEFLWDRLYPNLESFISGLLRGQRAALARLVQVHGLYQSEKIVGKQVWQKFPWYKDLIHPSHRHSLEILWKIEQKLILS